MAAPPMDPTYEQRLRNEVIFLHSLWHQGPPRSTPSSSSSSSAARHHHHLPPSNPTKFKKQKKQKPKRSNSSPGLEWPIPTPPPPSSSTSWPPPNPNPNPNPKNPQSSHSPEEKKSNLSANHVHHRALKVVHDYFSYDNDGSDYDSIGSSSDEDGDLMDEDDGREAYSFFFEVFREDDELREYYERSYAKGEFTCLICGALGGRKMGKKFKGCLALVQHAIAVAKTKRSRAHRAYGQAVCKVLGWDVNELSSIVSLLSEKSGEGNGGGEKKESSMAIVDNVGKNDEAVAEGGSVGTGVLRNSDEGEMNGLMCNDADKRLEDSGMENNVEEPAVEGLTGVIGSGDINESSMAIVDNVLTVAGKNDEAAPESDAVCAGILDSTGDEGDTNSLTCADADKNLEELGMVHPHNVEESAVEALTNNSLTCPAADQNFENTELMLPHYLEGPASEGLTITCPVADQNLETIDNVLPHHLEEPTADLLTSVPFNENNAAGNEMQDLKMDYVNWLIKDNEIEN